MYNFVIFIICEAARSYTDVGSTVWGSTADAECWCKSSFLLVYSFVPLFPNKASW